MPTKGCPLKLGPRKTIINKELYDFYKASTSDPVDYKTFLSIVLETNRNIKQWVLEEPSGFMLPNTLGFLAINKFKPKKCYASEPLSKIFKTRMPSLNLHSYGCVFFIDWFNRGARVKRIRTYQFHAERKFKRALAQKIFEGSTIYNYYHKDHFRNIFFSHFDDE